MKLFVEKLIDERANSGVGAGEARRDQMDRVAGESIDTAGDDVTDQIIIGIERAGDVQNVQKSLESFSVIALQVSVFSAIADDVGEGSQIAQVVQVWIVGQ